MRTHFLRPDSDGWAAVSGASSATVIVTDTNETPVERVLYLISQTLVRPIRDGKPIFATVQEIGPGRSI
jgi:hypothetical protein